LLVLWIYDLLFLLKERDLWFRIEFWQKKGVRLRKRWCYT
jgi:hypothetical protein